MEGTLAYQAANLTPSVFFFFKALITISSPAMQFLSVGLALVLPVVVPPLLFTKTRVFVCYYGLLMLFC